MKIKNPLQSLSQTPNNFSLRWDSMERLEKPFRKAVRVDLSKNKITVAYKFLTKDKKVLIDDIFFGKLIDLSNGGMQILGKIPNLKWCLDLGSGEILLGCNIAIFSEKIKVLGQVRWLKSAEIDKEKMEHQHRLGIKFLEIDKKCTSFLKSFLIKKQIKTNKLNRSGEMLLDPTYIGDMR